MKRFRRGKPFQETQTRAVQVPKNPNDVTNTDTPNLLLPCMTALCFALWASKHCAPCVPCIFRAAATSAAPCRPLAEP